MTAATLLPTTERLLRGVMSALAEIDVEGRPDLAHQLGMANMVLGHLHDRGAAIGELRALHGDILGFVAAGGWGVGTPPPAFDAKSFDEAQRQVGEALAWLGAAVSAAGRVGLATGDPVWRQAQELEQRFYATVAIRTQPIDAPAPLTRNGFEAYLIAKFPDRYRRVAGFKRLVGGFQKETILVDLETVSGTIEAAVIRAEKHDRLVAMTASAIVDEFAVVSMLWTRGIPVAEPLWLEDDEGRLGRRFMVSRRAAGANTGSAYGDSAAFPEALLRSFLGVLAAIHALPFEADVTGTALGRWLRYPTLDENIRADVADWRHQLWGGELPPSPAFTRVFDWLEANIPDDDGDICVIHNDYGPHNILVEGDAVTAVLDWEVPRIGDPAGDIGFFLQCTAGSVDRDRAIAIYEELSGRRFSRFRLAYYEVMSIAKVFVSTLSATTLYQATEPALLDWMQMPLRGHGAYQRLMEDRIAAAEAVRGT